MAIQLASVARGHYIEVTVTMLIRKAVMSQITGGSLQWLIWE